MTWRPCATPAVLVERARLLDTIRAFFRSRGVLEVQTPVAGLHAVPTPHIDSVATDDGRRFLRTSPEFAHKRLLAAGCGDIYEIGPVFRAGETGRRHNPEFTLLEWYRTGFDEHELMREVARLLAIMVPALSAPPRFLTYADAVRRFGSLDIWSASDEAVRAAAASRAPLPDAPLTRDDLLDLLFVSAVAPAFARDAVTFVYDYPASQCALAALSTDDPRTARRFEAYVGELELANGFFELRDAKEQRARFVAENRHRVILGKPPVAIDERFLAALDAGLPACAGVALGFDRAVMLAVGVDHIRDTMAFDDDSA